jgi:hypothetical protein
MEKWIIDLEMEFGEQVTKCSEFSDPNIAGFLYGLKFCAV